MGMAAPATPLTEAAADERATAVDDYYGAPADEEWRNIDWRRHQRWVSLPGGPVNVIERGEGPPLVLVHGHSGRWANWLANIPHFSRTHRVIAMDLPGFGHSPMPREPITIENYGRTLDALMDRLDLTAAPVVGNSMGGFAAAELAIKFPPRVERLALVSAAGLATKYLGLSTEFFRRRSYVALTRAINLYAGIPEARAETLVRRPRLRRQVLAIVVRHPERLSGPMAFELMRGAGKPAAADATDAIMDYDYRDRVGEIACPTLIVWGRNDRVVPVSSAEEYHRLIERSRVDVFDDTGHVPMLERPTRFNTALDAFLREEPAGTAE
jgi:pimeloyl-ACP methyl ester carboxylesterase